MCGRIRSSVVRRPRTTLLGNTSHARGDVYSCAKVAGLFLQLYDGTGAIPCIRALQPQYQQIRLMPSDK
jgi:hypothetical protein